MFGMSGQGRYFIRLSFLIFISVQLVLLAVVDLLHSCSSKMAGHLDHTSEGLVLLFEK